MWERALRRANLPIAYSEGFSPHPKISFTDALPLGCASDGEYAELLFAGPVNLEAAMATLNPAFPDGMEVTTAVAVEDGAPKLSKWLVASCWDAEYPVGTDLTSAVAEALAADTLVVARERKGETVEVDIRPALHAMSTDGARLRVTVLHVDHLPPSAAVAVRPSEVELALRRFVPDLQPAVLVTRLAQGRPEANGLVEALTGELIEPLPRPLQRQPS